MPRAASSSSRRARSITPYVEAIRHPGIVEHIGRALKGEETEGLELSVTRDTTRTLVARVAPVVTAGRGAVLVLHDITELRKADLVRRDFVANVSHELRTPLTAIKGYAEALLDDPEDADAREKFLDIIHRHATRMERLVKDLLRLARLDAGPGKRGARAVRCRRPVARHRQRLRADRRAKAADRSTSKWRRARRRS